MEDLEYFLNNYLNYMNIIKGRSKNTIKEYSYDLVNFLGFYLRNLPILIRLYLKIRIIPIYQLKTLKKLN